MLLSERDRLHAYFSGAAPMTVLAPQDTTDLDFTGKRAAGKLDSLNYANRKGYYAHNHLLLNSQGVSLGLFGQRLWGRDAQYFGEDRSLWPLEEKESVRWLDGFLGLQSFFSQFPQHTAFDICDREADFYELFAARSAKNVHLIVRSSKNRALPDREKLWETLDNQPFEGIHLANIYSPKGKKAQMAFQIKYAPIDIPPSYRAKRDQPGCGPVQLYGIVIEQVSPLESWQKKNIKWRLLTTLPLEDVDRALQVLQYYTLRWRIEEFHYVLKQGPKLEQKQLKEPSSLKNAITLYSLASWKILNLRYRAATNPDEDIRDIGFTETQYKVAAIFLNKNRKTDFDHAPDRPTVRQFVKMLKLIATTSRSKSPPGVRAIWVGLTKLALLVKAYETFT
jgi:hypothetical protein